MFADEQMLTLPLLDGIAFCGIALMLGVLIGAFFGYLTSETDRSKVKRRIDAESWNKGYWDGVSDVTAQIADMADGHGFLPRETETKDK